MQLREQAAPDLPSVLDKAIELAKEGDRHMIKLLLELHMAKGQMDKENAVEKVEININSTAPTSRDVTPSKPNSITIDGEVIKSE